MAYSVKEAEKLGLINRKKAKQISAQLKQQAKAVGERLRVATNKAGGNYDLDVNSDPQRKIYAALEKAQPGIAMWEVEGLVSGRQYRCDIYLPESRVVIEMDGYGPHKSLEQFKSDRDKRNLLASTGYIVLCFYYEQVKNNIEGVVSQILATHEFYKPFMKDFFDAHLQAIIKTPNI